MLIASMVGTSLLASPRHQQAALAIGIQDNIMESTAPNQGKSDLHKIIQSKLVFHLSPNNHFKNGVYSL